MAYNRLLQRQQILPTTLLYLQLDSHSAVRHGRPSPSIPSPHRPLIDAADDVHRLQMKEIKCLPVDQR